MALSLLRASGAGFHCFRIAIVCSACAAALSGCRDREAPEPRPALTASSTQDALELRAWSRMSPADLGCLLERRFGLRDPRFGCQRKGYENDADPCEDEPRWREGPQVPDELAPRLAPGLRHVELAWEEGALQRALFVFAPSVTEAELPRLLRVPRGALPEAASVGPGRCQAGPCYEVVFFAPAPVECEDDEDEDSES